MKRNGLKSLVMTALFSVVVAIAAPSWAADAVKIGIMYSLSGPGSSIGTLQEEGAKLAIKDLNDKGGITIGGKKVKVEGVYRDDETKPQVAIQRLHEMSKDYGVQLLVGSTFGNINGALNNEVKKTGHYYLTTNGAPESFFKKTEKAPYALNMTATSESAGVAAAIFMATNSTRQRRPRTADCKQMAAAVCCFSSNAAAAAAAAAAAVSSALTRRMSATMMRA